MACVSFLREIEMHGAIADGSGQVNDVLKAVDKIGE